MNIAVYCGSSSGNNLRFIESAKILGKWIGENGHTLVYGGANKGLMGAVASAVIEAGGKVIGVIPDVAIIQARKHTGLTELIETKSMAERKSKMIELADVFVALPGGIGTLDEITEVMSLSSLEIIKGPIVLYNTDGYYRPLKAVLDNILSAEFGRREYFEKVLLSEDIKEIAEFISNRKEK
ncbi:MAG: TIGR00730 family Rossman fold protein [Butyrivibrio sp.]|uniref:LOG family protein n=1 Tax=Butyrivibrio sp. TaxID=28121 RepID=UPI001B014D12|nr:TIGR00730 family Rossman fold protein [Butyrivibrio sp.]MBO6240602.1 TIGR00730 family Rossman fold protein [Butyrivibrio sp.]